MTSNRTAADHHRRRHPGRERRALADRRPGRPDPAAGPLPDRADGPLQPGADPGAPAARQGRRRVRHVRGDRGRQRATPRPRCSSRAPRPSVLIRFSTVAGERGSPDTWRDPRGFALKFYTSEGNYDMVGNNTPVFFIRDPMKFQHFIRSPEAPRRQQPARPRHAVGLLDAVAGVGAPGDLADGRPGHPAHLAAHERLLQPHLHVDQRRRREVLGEVPLQDRPGHRVLHPGRGRPDGRGRHRLPHARPVRAHRRRRVPELDAEDADHAVRGREDLPVQPVRPDQGVAARRLPAASRWAG